MHKGACILAPPVSMGCTGSFTGSPRPNLSTSYFLGPRLVGRGKHLIPVHQWAKILRMAAQLILPATEGWAGPPTHSQGSWWAMTHRKIV